LLFSQLVLYFLPIIPLSQQGSLFMHMDDHPQLSRCENPAQLMLYASRNVAQLCTKARGLSLRVNTIKTEVLYILPRGAGAKRNKIDPARISVQVEGASSSIRPSSG